MLNFTSTSGRRRDAINNLEIKEKSVFMTIRRSLWHTFIFFDADANELSLIFVIRDQNGVVFF